MTGVNEHRNTADGTTADEIQDAADHPVDGVEDDGLPFADPELAAAQMGVKPKSKIRGGLVGAAMLAVGEIIEPAKTNVSVEAAAEADARDDDHLAGVDFSGLPPLD